MLTNVAVPSVVSSIPHMPVNSAVGHFSPSVLVSPTLPLSVGPFVCLPSETHFPIHQDVATNNVSVQTPASQVFVPEHHNSQDSGRYVHDSQMPVEERVQDTRVSEPLQQQLTHERADGRWSSDRLDDVSYRDKILDDDISRERLEKRLMKERIERWKIRDGVDSDRVEFERLRTPHRNLIDAGMFSTFLLL